jgi:hypothetical protein
MQYVDEQPALSAYWAPFHVRRKEWDVVEQDISEVSALADAKRKAYLKSVGKKDE